MSVKIKPAVTSSGGGTGGTGPGGSNTQMQFNDSGTLAGATGAAWDKTQETLTLSNDLVNGGGVKYSQLTIANPAFNTAYTPETSNTEFYIDLSDGFHIVNNRGSATQESSLTLGFGLVAFNADAGMVFTDRSSTFRLNEDTGGAAITADAFTVTCPKSAGSLVLNVTAGDVSITGTQTVSGLVTGNSGFVAQAVGGYVSYNSFTSVANHEKGFINWSSNVFQIGTLKAGTGTARAFRLSVEGNLWNFSTSGGVSIEASGQTTGNARGTGAIELSTSRDNAAKVASGNNSVQIGPNNTSSGTNSVTLGTYNVASTTYATALGYLSSATNVAQFAFGAGVAAGKAQTNILSFSATTTNNTPTETFATGTTFRNVLVAKGLWVFFGIGGGKSDTGKAVGYQISGLITRDGSNVTRLVGTPTITRMGYDTEVSAANISVTEDDTNESLKITVTGVTGLTMQWHFSVFAAQTIGA